MPKAKEVKRKLAIPTPSWIKNILCRDFGKVLAYNTRSQRVVIKRKEIPFEGQFPRELKEYDFVDISEYFEYKYKLKLTLDAAVSHLMPIITNPRNFEQFDPFKDWLEGLKWDGTERLEGVLQLVAGVESSLYTMGAMRCMMVSAVARTYQPGCKVDTMMILQGEQGLNKSTFFRKLLPADKYFCDNMPDIRHYKEAREVLPGLVILEVSELDAFSKAESSAIKSFLVTQTDRFRAAYGRSVQDYPRTNIFVGTANPETFLKDNQNRRFMPVTVERKIDINWLVNNREQVWAEAVMLYKKGAIWWLTGDAEKEHVEKAKQYRQTTTWEEKIDHYLRVPYSKIRDLENEYSSHFDGSIRQYTTLHEIMENVLDVELKNFDRRKQSEVTIALRALDWKRARRRVEGNRVYVYIAPKDWQMNLGSGYVSKTENGEMVQMGIKSVDY